MTDTNTQASYRAVVAIIDCLTITPVIEGLAFSATDWAFCETVQDTYDLMKRKLQSKEVFAALSAALPEIRRDAKAEDGWKFAIGDQVQKHSGAWWEGTVVGTYSTEQTPRGYCVQLNKPNGPVQIYPEAALATLPEPPADKETDHV